MSKINKAKQTRGLRYPAINDLIEKAENKYELVLAASRRARRIIDGEPTLVTLGIDNPVSAATAEIEQGLVTIIDGEPEPIREPKPVVEVIEKVEMVNDFNEPVHDDFDEELDEAISDGMIIIDDVTEDFMSTSAAVDPEASEDPDNPEDLEAVPL